VIVNFKGPRMTFDADAVNAVAVETDEELELVVVSELELEEVDPVEELEQVVEELELEEEKAPK
jgi:hypothetical protein